MNDFDSLLKTKASKKAGHSNVIEIYRQARNENKIFSLEDLQLLNTNDLLKRDLKHKIDKTLLSLWGMLDMKSFVDALSGNTVNPYFLTSKNLKPIKDLPEYTYLSDEARLLNLLDIKYIKKFELEGITFNEVFLVTYEIADKNNELRPFVTFLTLNNDNQFIEFGYGYDTNDNGNVELFLSSYNYLVYLTPKGSIHSPLSGKMTKLKIQNILTSEEIAKLYR